MNKTLQMKIPKTTVFYFVHFGSQLNKVDTLILFSQEIQSSRNLLDGNNFLKHAHGRKR